MCHSVHSCPGTSGSFWWNAPLLPCPSAGPLNIQERPLPLPQGMMEEGCRGSGSKHQQRGPWERRAQLSWWPLWDRGGASPICLSDRSACQQAPWPSMDVPVASWPCKGVSLELWGNFLLHFCSLVASILREQYWMLIPGPCPPTLTESPQVCVCVCVCNALLREEKERKGVMFVL